jgi:hypothetical protein
MIDGRQLPISSPPTNMYINWIRKGGGEQPLLILFQASNTKNC